MNVRRVPYLIAEIGVNHDGDVVRAEAMVRESARAGFDAVKFQYWIAEELLADEAPTAEYQGDGDQRALLEPLELAPEALVVLREVAHEVGVDFAVTADGVRALDDVVAMGPDFLKVGSGDADNPWLLDAVARAGLPTVLSVGMSVDEEIDWMVRRLAPVDDLVVLHCVSAYPTPLAESNLGRIPHLAALTGRPVGLSDHTMGSAAGAAAVALGAVVVEKHVTWDVSAAGPDHAMSLGLDRAGAWVDQLRGIGASLRNPVASVAEGGNRLVVRKALLARRDLPAGHRLGTDDLEPKRPLLDGIPARARDEVVGRSVLRDVSAGSRLTWDDLG